MKIRCTGTTAKMVSHWGAAPVAMPQTETYDAVQKGVVDGLMSPIETLKGWKFAEVTQIYHPELRLRLFHGLFCGHEQTEMELPAQRHPGVDSKGQ